MKVGLFRPQGNVHCLKCIHGADFMAKDQFTDERVVTTCEKCGIEIVVAGRDDVAQQRNACIELNEILERECKGDANACMTQTGGMCSAGFYGFGDGTSVMFNNEKYDNRFLLIHYNDEEAISSGDDSDWKVIGEEMSVRQIADYIKKICAEQKGAATS